MTLVLSNEDAEKILTMRGAIDALEQLYMDLGKGSAINRARTDLFTPTVADVGADIPSRINSKHWTVPSRDSARHRSG